MKRHIWLGSGAVIASIVVSACGGGGGGESNTNVSASPTPAATPAPATSSPSAPAPAGAPPAAGSPPASSPPASAPPAAAPPAVTINLLSDLPAGDQVGGVTNTASSGYSPGLLTGRWESNDTAGNCIDIPANFCGTAVSFAFRQGYDVSGLSATRYGEIRYFNGAACQNANQVATARFASDIAFQGADTLIANAQGGQIAVRRGIESNERVIAIDNTAINSLFQNCRQFQPDVNPAPSPQQTCTEHVSLRIEASPANRPLLFVDEGSTCQPGSVCSGRCLSDDMEHDQP